MKHVCPASLFLIGTIFSFSSCRLDMRGTPFRISAPTVSTLDVNGFSNSYIIIGEPQPGVRIFYTTNGAENPAREGTPYTGPLFIGEEKVLDVWAAARRGSLGSPAAHFRIDVKDKRNTYTPKAEVFNPAAPEKAITADSSGKLIIKSGSPCLRIAERLDNVKYFYGIDDSMPMITAEGKPLNASTREIAASKPVDLPKSGSHQITIISWTPDKGPGRAAAVSYRMTAQPIEPPKVGLGSLAEDAGAWFLNPDTAGDPWFTITRAPGLAFEWRLRQTDRWQKAEGAGLGRAELSAALAGNGPYTLYVRSVDTSSQVSQSVSQPFTVRRPPRGPSAGRSKPPAAAPAAHAPPVKEVSKPAVKFNGLITYKGTDCLYPKTLKRQWVIIELEPGLSLQWKLKDSDKWKTVKNKGEESSEISNALEENSTYTLQMRSVDERNQPSDTVKHTFTVVKEVSKPAAGLDNLILEGGTWYLNPNKAKDPWFTITAKPGLSVQWRLKETDDWKEAADSILGKRELSEALEENGIYTLQMRSVDQRNQVSEVVKQQFTVSRDKSFLVKNGRKIGTVTVQRDSSGSVIGRSVKVTSKTAAESAFAKNKVTSVQIGDEVEAIELGAFIDNPLTELTLGSKLKSIGELAFYDCKLKGLIIPNSLETIGNSAFTYNPLTELTLGSKLKSIGEMAFYDCKLKGLIIPNSLETIGNSAFTYNPLTELTLGSKLKSIGETAFYGCKLKRLIIPNAVETIGNAAFTNNKQLTELTLGSKLKNIGELAFKGCKLTKVTIPKSVEEIGGYAFEMKTLKEVTISQETLDASHPDAFSSGVVFKDYNGNTIYPITLQ